MKLNVTRKMLTMLVVLVITTQCCCCIVTPVSRGVSQAGLSPAQSGLVETWLAGARAILTAASPPDLTASAAQTPR